MLKRIAAVAVALLALLGGPLGTGAARAAYVQDLTAMTNSDRGARGLHALSTAGDLQAFAQKRADEMARSRRLAHTKDLGSKISGWQRLGENVGRGPTIQEIQAAFMASASHRQNILDPGFTQIGVGATFDGKDYVYVAVIFRLPSGSSAAAAPKPEPKPAPKPAPRPATPPTTRAAAAPKPRPTTTTQAPTTTTQAPTTTTTTPPPPPPVEEIAPPVESTTTTMESTTTTAPRPITKNPDFLAANFADRPVPVASRAPATAPGRPAAPIIVAAALGLVVGSASSAALRLEFKRSKAARTGLGS